jgi:hypothetical protein
MSRIVVDVGSADGAVDGFGGWMRVILDGRECAISEEGLRGYWVLKGPKPVMSTLTSVEDGVSSRSWGASWRGYEGIVVLVDWV